MVTPLTKPRIVKKRTKRFRRHFSDRVKHIDASWRVPRGIDSRARRRFRSVLSMPYIGYGSNKKVREKEMHWL
jgi:large subunit ribosomal protein L32e